MKTKIALKKLNVLVLTFGIYPNSVGGAEIQLFNLVCRLSERGHNFYVITSVNGNLNKSSKIRIPYANFRLRLWPKPFNILSYTLKSLILSLRLREQINVIHVHTADYPMIAGFLFSLFSHKPYIVACRGSDIRISSRKFLHRAFRLPFLRNAKTLVAVSNEIAELLTNKYGICRHRILVIRNAYDDRVMQEIARNKVQAENLRPKRIVCVANMRPEKDHMTLLKGFKRITKSIDEAQLLLIGDGPLRLQLEKFCARHRLRNVRFLGRIPFNEVLENVAKSDIFILTSIEEAMPNAVIEALALGKPVIATRVGGIPEIVKDGFNGILIPPKSPQHVARALRTLLRDEKLYSKLSSNATNGTILCSWSEIVLRYEQMYANLLNLP